jgi:hypothetical protein
MSAKFCELCGALMVISPKGNGYMCADELCPNHEKLEPIMCANCGKRPGVNDWVGEGGIFGWVHGMSQKWCEICCVREQLRHATELATRIPALKKELERLENEYKKGNH